MAITQKHYDSIKADFEKNDGWQLSLELVNHQYLIRELLPDYPNEMRFSFKAKNMEWGSFSHVEHEPNVFVFKTSVATTGDLIFYTLGKETDRKAISLNFAIEVPCLYVPDADFISYLRESVVIKTGELHTITDFDTIVLDEFNKLTMLPPLDFGIYSSIWPFNEPGNDIHVFISSHTYYSEIDNMYRQVRYSIALANTYGHYANRYFTRELRQPFLHYPMNFTSNDRRYLDFCTGAIHYMYVYWERLALLIFQYHQPPNVTSKNLSFVKLIKGLSKDPAVSTVNLSWFTQFLDNEHEKIQELRHPLVHFKLDPLKHKGSYVPMIHDAWLNDTRNKQQLLDLEENSKALIGEIIRLAQKCEEGYRRSLQLIIDLKNATTTAAKSTPIVTQPE
jgi:hypothetical protein